MTTFQKQLCNMLQSGLEIVERPFERIGDILGHDESAILDEIRLLKSLGYLGGYPHC